jgi:hypothetical protein
MKPCRRIAAWVATVFAVLGASQATALTVSQSATSDSIAFEAEAFDQLIASTPTTWVVTNEPAASGGAALFQSGQNDTAAQPSFALYRLRFSRAGTYTLYYRWRADAVRTGQDANGANSFRRPNTFGDLPVDQFGAAAVNNAIPVPAANSYNVFKDSQTFTVTEADVSAGTPLLFKVGTREQGMIVDRWVFSLNDSLTESGVNDLANSATDLIAQGATQEFVAFEAENFSSLVASTPTTWTVTNEPAASGGASIFQSGQNDTAAQPSFVFYTLRFSRPGTYTLYYRWRADAVRTGQDANGANSFRRPNTFGDIPVDQFGAAAVNNAIPVPAANSYNVFRDSQTYEVTEADVAAGVPLIFKVGTREQGMIVDRWVLALNATLTEADFNNLPNSGADAERPQFVGARGSASFTTVVASFSRPISSSSVNPSRFTLSGGLTVSAAAVNEDNAREVILTTSRQLENTRYTITATGVQDVSGNTLSGTATNAFTSWRLSTGWVTRELYLNVAGNTVAELMAAEIFPGRPNQVDVLRGFGFVNTPPGQNYGARLTSFFIPPTSGAYDFFIYSDDNSALFLSSDETEANLGQLVENTVVNTAFDATIFGTSPSLVAGRRYLLQVLIKQWAPGPPDRQRTSRHCRFSAGLRSQHSSIPTSVSSRSPGSPPTRQRRRAVVPPSA